MSAGDNDTPTNQVVLNLPVRVWRAFQAAARQDKISEGDALRRAISVDLYLRGQVREGCRLLVEKPMELLSE
jgi:hypothetical protein